MTTEEWLFWEKWPRLVPLYETFRNRLLEELPGVTVKVAKTQISFFNRRMFAMASPPVRRRKEWPKEFMLVSFGLPCRADSPRIAISTEPYPNRWTHHVLLESAESVDEELLGWIKEAYFFADSKR